MSKILLENIDLSDLLTDIRKIIAEEITKAKQIDLSEKLLSPAETCKLLYPAISKQTLYRWTKEGWVKSYLIGRNVFYRYSDVIESAKELKRYKRPVRW